MRRKKAYTRVVKPGTETQTKTQAPSPDLKNVVDEYLKLVQQRVDDGSSADEAFKTKPDLDDLTADALLELLLNNPGVGDAPIKQLNYLDLYSILQFLLEQRVWQLAIEWWGKQETKVQEEAARSKERDETETVVLKTKGSAARRYRLAQTVVSYESFKNKNNWEVAKVQSDELWDDYYQGHPADQSPMGVSFLVDMVGNVDGVQIPIQFEADFYLDEEGFLNPKHFDMLQIPKDILVNYRGIPSPLDDVASDLVWEFTARELDPKTAAYYEKAAKKKLKKLYRPHRRFMTEHDW